MQKIKIDKMPDEQRRIETGAVQFEYPNGDIDWKSLNIRGDNCMELAMNINIIANFLKDKELDFFQKIALNNLISIRDEITQEVLQR